MAANQWRREARALIDTIEAARVDALMKGAVDLHVHSGPSTMPRQLDHLEQVEQAAQAGMRGVLFKDHHYSVSPMMAMLESLVANRTSGGDHHPVLFLHACETPQQHSFASRIRTLEQQIPALKSFTWYASAESEGSFHGLMELAPLNDILPLANGNFYLCGPSAFMKFVKDQLLALGVTGERIHYEVFGPHAEL